MCTSIAAGKKATADGNVLIARNEDYPENNWAKHMKFRQQPQYAHKECIVEGMLRLGNGLCVPVPDNSFSYSSICDAGYSDEASYPVSDGYFFEERGINEKGVAVSATNSMGINERALQCDPVVSPGMEESVIATLILPQAESARDAVKRLGTYVESYGAAEANGIMAADLDEVWYMEILSGHHWIAVRVPDDSYLVVANCMRIRGVNLKDEDNVMCSEGLYDFVCNNGLLDEVDECCFDAAGAFGYYWQVGNPENTGYNIDRLWLAQYLLTPSLRQKTRLTEYPLFLKPDAPIAVETVKRVLRGTYQGTSLKGMADRPIGAVRTAESHIIVLDSTLPVGVNGIIWQCVSTPLGSPYLPVFSSLIDYPEEYSMGDSRYVGKSAYWAFRSLFSLADMMNESVLETVWRGFEEAVNVRFAAIHSVLQKSAGEADTDTLSSEAAEFSKSIMKEAVLRAVKERDIRITAMAAGQQDKN